MFNELFGQALHRSLAISFACSNRQHCLCATNELPGYAILLGWHNNRLEGVGFKRINGGRVATASIRVLVVDDMELFRRFIVSTLRARPELQVIGEASDGLEAVQKAQELQPDLILLDIGLPKLNGMEAARQIRSLSPKSKILFVSQECSADVVQHAFSLGACGYVVKMDAGGELLAAADAVLRDEQFVGGRFAGHDFTAASDSPGHPIWRDDTPASPALKSLRNTESTRRHEVLFHSDDAWLLDNVTQFVGAALNAGNSAIVLATEAHRDSLLWRLQARGINVSSAIEQGSYVTWDAAEALSTFMVNDMVDAVLFLEGFSKLILKAAKAATREQPRVAIFGECVRLLWERGNVEAAMQDEKLCNELTRRYDVDILCGYSLGSFQGGTDNHMFAKICAEHSAVHPQ
jgi:DNA-binding NarL/FixJ family response regulator